MNAENLRADPNEYFLSLCRSAYPETKVVIHGNLPEVCGPLQFVNKMVWELTDNCVDQGAQHVRITYGHGKLIIEDDVFHTNPQVILSNINSENPQTTSGEAERGFGIKKMRELVEKRNGSLLYEEKEGKITACASWDAENGVTNN